MSWGVWGGVPQEPTICGEAALQKVLSAQLRNLTDPLSALPQVSVFFLISFSDLKKGEEGRGYELLMPLKKIKQGKKGKQPTLPFPSLSLLWNKLRAKDTAVIEGAIVIDWRKKSHSKKGTPKQYANLQQAHYNQLPPPSYLCFAFPLSCALSLSYDVCTMHTRR